MGAVQSNISVEAAQAAYGCHITYVTGQELCFNYLKDNTAQSAAELVRARDGVLLTFKTKCAFALAACHVRTTRCSRRPAGARACDRSVFCVSFNCLKLLVSREDNTAQSAAELARRGCAW